MMLTKPSQLPITSDEWEKLSPALQKRLADFADEYERSNLQHQLQNRRTRWIAWLASIFAFVLIGVLALVSAIYLRPYARVRFQRDEIVCAYRPPMTYTIQQGDTLFALSLRYEVPVEVLASANGLSNINIVEKGLQITIPEAGCVHPDVNTRIADDRLTATSAHLSATPTPNVEEVLATVTQAMANYKATEARWQTVTAVYTPPDLTRTTATPTGEIDSLDQTATHIISEATKSAAPFITLTAEAAQ